MSPNNFHPVNECLGNCAQHPLMRLEYLAMSGIWNFDVLDNYGIKYTSWATINEDEFTRIESSMTSEQKSDKENFKLAQKVDEELNHEANRMFRYAESSKQLNSRGKGRDRHIDKMDEPCRWLYCDESVPKSKWKMNAKGEYCAPVVNHLTGAHCWAHEYQDPKTKLWHKPHACKRLHPNEDGWRDEWDTDRIFRPKTFVTARLIAAPKKQAVDNSAW